MTVSDIRSIGLSSAESPDSPRTAKSYFQRELRQETGLVQQPVQIVARFAITI
jgi:hypothetical protein